MKKRGVLTERERTQMFNGPAYWRDVRAIEYTVLLAAARGILKASKAQPTYGQSFAKWLRARAAELKETKR